MSGKPCVLIVDDDLDTREMYGWCLEGHGMRVVLAASAGDALAQIAREVPDALITDYTLPGGDGFALASKLRQAPATSHVALLLVSGRDFAGETQARVTGVFDRVLLKPVLPDQLVTELMPLLARGSAVPPVASGLQPPQP